MISQNLATTDNLAIYVQHTYMLQSGHYNMINYQDILYCEISIEVWIQHEYKIIYDLYIIYCVRVAIYVHIFNNINYCIGSYGEIIITTKLTNHINIIVLL